MSVRTTATTPVTRARIGRQTLHDDTGSVVGYELLFSPGTTDDDPRTRDRIVSSVISTAFGEFGLHRLGPRRSLYVNMTRAFLTGELPMPFGPYNVVLEVLGDLHVDTDLVDGIERLKGSGFRLAIDGHVNGPEQARLLPLVDVVKIDVPAIGEDVEGLAQYLRRMTPRAALMAEDVTDRNMFDQVLGYGFTLFQGPYFQRKAPAKKAGVGPSQMMSLRLLAALSDPDTSTVDIEEIITADPGLSLRVLKAINSAGGAVHEVRSIRQAIVLMGRRTMSAWVMLAALGGQAENRREDMIEILTRARMCEMLGTRLDVVESSTAYTAGLLSGAVDVMGLDPQQVAEGTRMDSEMTDALARREGRIGDLLTVVDDFNRTGHSDGLLSNPEVSRAHLLALGTAMDTVDAILGEPS